MFLFRWVDSERAEEAGDEHEDNDENECKDRESNGSDAIWFANQVNLRLRLPSPVD
jgi:hypothetical protein